MRRTGLVVLLAALFAVLAPTAGAAPRDNDRDGLPDRWEKRHRLSTKAGSANADADRDRVDNGNEWREGSSPRDSDSDNDGRRDGREDADRDKLSNADEDATGNDPKDRDTDDDGVIDGREHAGVISSYRNGNLRIKLARGSKISGAVTEETEVSCSNEGDAERKWLGAGAFAAQDDLDDEGDGYEEEPDEGDGYEEEPDEDGLDEDGDEFDDLDDLEQGFEPDGEADACPQSRLKTGVTVHQAELELGPDGAVFVRIDLLR